jgi:Trehalose utilisation
MITEGPRLREAYWPADTSLPVMETTVGGVLQAAAKAAPGRTGLVFAQPGDPVRRRWTFAGLLTESERAAGAVRSRGKDRRLGAQLPGVAAARVRRCAGRRAVARGRSGTGFAGWHGGIVDAFRAEPVYSLVTGGQFVYHPRGFVSYEVRPAGDRADHPVLAGVEAFTITTEQYYLHVDPGIDVLAVTDFVADPAYPDLAGVVMPVTWTRRWGAAGCSSRRSATRSRIWKCRRWMR